MTNEGNISYADSGVGGLMVAFEISINGIKKCTAGIGSDGLVSIMLFWLQRQIETGNPHENKLDFQVDARTWTGKVAQDLKWIEEVLQIGDTISIAITDTSEITEPASRKRETFRDRERDERYTYERLKKKYRKVNRRRRKHTG